MAAGRNRPAKGWTAMKLAARAVAMGRSALGGATLRSYVQIARPDHWIKNIFVIPGAAIALAIAPSGSGLPLMALGLALVSVCLVASANYTINEYLDAAFDRYHPLKSDRPVARGILDGRLVLLQY